MLGLSLSSLPGGSNEQPGLRKRVLHYLGSGFCSTYRALEKEHQICLGCTMNSNPVLTTSHTQGKGLRSFGRDGVDVMGVGAGIAKFLSVMGLQSGVSPGDCKRFSELWTKERGCHLAEESGRISPSVECLMDTR